jgi:site-specific recombinase XerD
VGRCVPWIALTLLYGTGMRLMECLRLRVQDVDFAQNQITIRDGKGGKDRRTMPPGAVKPALVQELLGHANVNTPIIYTHVLNRGGFSVDCPADNL